MKTREAAKRGAIGSIVYSDPIEDGYVRGDVYPKGQWRPSTGFERGSFLDVPIYPGDPLTPGQPSIPGVERLKPEQAESIQKIPTIVHFVRGRAEAPQASSAARSCRASGRAGCRWRITSGRDRRRSRCTSRTTIRRGRSGT